MNAELRKRVAVGLLSISAAGFATWQASEDLTTVAVIPTKGDVPTIGHGSTRYEDGSQPEQPGREARSATSLPHSLHAWC